MPLFKRCSNCGKRIEVGSKCECTKKRYISYDKHFRDKESKKTYDGKQWEIIREEVLELDGGIDVYLLMTEGKIAAADTVHHIVPLKDDRSKAYDKDNLISLNNDTHSMIEQRYKTDKQQMQQLLKKILHEYRTQGLSKSFG